LKSPLIKEFNEMIQLLRKNKAGVIKLQNKIIAKNLYKNKKSP